VVLRRLIKSGRRREEEDRRDNLLVFYDRNAVTTYAVEAVRLIDHYRFRAAMKPAASAKPLSLKKRSEHCALAWVNPKNARVDERLRFVR
jgi:hypothetical protein